MSAGQTLASWARDIGNRRRLVLVVKGAVAASVAWYLAPLMPFTEDKYSYYAPLGVIISMYPTLAGSAKSGLQALIGLVLGVAVGIGLGVGTLALGGPRVLAVGLVVAVGMLLSGLRALGVGRDWITIPALFVLLLGASNPESFSVGYLVTMAFGVIVGVAVNLLIFPPLYLRRAAERLSVLRDMVAERLRDMADAFAHGKKDGERLGAALDELVETAATVRSEVLEANESGKGNPRSRRHGAQDEENYRRLRALERTVFFVRDLADVLGAIEQKGTDDEISERARHELAEAMNCVAALVAMPNKAEGSGERLKEAETAVGALMDSLDEGSGSRPSTVAHNVTATVCLTRIIDASRPFVLDQPA